MRWDATASDFRSIWTNGAPAEKDAFKDLKGVALIQSAPEGIASATPQSQLHTAGEHLHFVSGGDTAVGAGQNFTAHAMNSVNLFAQTTGMKMQANQGKVSIQAQNDEMQLNALKDVTVTSSNGKVTIAAKEEILITCQGAYIRLADGEVEIGTPKIIRFKGPIEVTGNNSLPYPLPSLVETRISSECLKKAANSGSAYVLR